MSNPFAIFRKNQNYWMAALVLLAILAFVVAPAIEQVQQALRGGGAANAVVVRWNGGRLTVSDLQNAMQKHGALVRFLNALAREVVAAGGEPKVPGFYYDPQSKQVLGLGIQTNSDEESICRTRILADKAKRLGVEFSDDAIDDFILAFCDGRVATRRIAEILRESSDARLSNFDVRELLKQELAAMVVRRTATTGFYATVPGETYQDFLKLNRTAKVQAFPVFVADYVSKVKGLPTEGEIQAIYDVGSQQLANPNSPDPGFVQPYQANIEYVESNIQEWVEREKAKLTEEQLKAEYDRLVGLEQLKVPVAKPPAADASLPASETPASETPASETPASSAPAVEAPGAEPATDAAAPAQADSQPSGAAPPPAAPATDDQSSRDAASRPATVRLVSTFAQPDDGLPPPVVQPPQLSTDATPAATSPAATSPAATSSATTSPDATSSATAAQPEMRTQTFEEAREQIADSLARSAAIPALDAALTNILEKVMKPYYGAYRQYAAFRDAKLEGSSGEKVEEPKRPNLKQLAEEAGLKYGQSGMTDGFKLSQTQFGMGEIRQDEMGFSGPVASGAMTPQLPLFQPLQSSYFDRAVFQQGRIPEFYQYLFWKTDEKPIRVPELSEIRADVVDYWKRQQARKLAETAAASLSKKVSGTGQEPWNDALSTAEQSLVIEPDPFSWISRMGDYNMTSNVNKLEGVGGEFMQSVFTASPGQVTVAPNQNKSVYYVVRVESFSPEEAELQQRFNADPDKRGPLSIAQEESNLLVQDWYENLYNELGVQFEIPLSSL